MSLKKGDLVEVINSISFHHLIGERFILSDISKVVVLPNDDFTMYKGELWDSPFISERGNIICFRSSHLKKVNPDGDELSDESFESLMTKLKEHHITIRLPSAVHCVHVKGTIDLEDI